MTSPRLSVIVSSYNSAGLIKACLRALERQTAKEDFEVIVVDSSDDGSAEMVRSRFPGVKLLRIPYPGSRALMRAQGVSHALGEIVAITEDHCVPQDDWVARIIENHRLPVAAVGGAVENSAEDRAAYWAIYFCEYYQFMPPVPRGAVADIPGSNASYKREALARAGLDQIGLWDSLVNSQLGNKDSSSVISDPLQVVHHNKREEPLSFLVHRYHFSRCFAGLRAKRVSFARRMFYLIFSPALPPLILWRTFREVWRKGRNRIDLIRSLPFLLPFLISSALGELMGNALGLGESWRKID